MEADPLIRQRVLADLGRGCTPSQIAGWLKLKATGTSVEAMESSIPAGGARISHEALYCWIYALPKGELARLGVMLPSKRGARRPHRKNGLSGARIVGCAPSVSAPLRNQGAGSPDTGKGTWWWARKVRAR